MQLHRAFEASVAQNLCRRARLHVRVACFGVKTWLQTAMAGWIAFHLFTSPGCTRCTQAEHGIHIDGFDAGVQREVGTASLLNTLGQRLAG